MKKIDTLTKRENEIISYVNQGFTNKMIADKLFISVATVKKHLENIYQKLQVQNRIQAIVKLRQHL